MNETEKVFRVPLNTDADTTGGVQVTVTTAKPGEAAMRTRFSVATIQIAFTVHPPKVRRRFKAKNGGTSPISALRSTAKGCLAKQTQQVDFVPIVALAESYLRQFCVTESVLLRCEIVDRIERFVRPATEPGHPYLLQ